MTGFFDLRGGCYGGIWEKPPTQIICGDGNFKQKDFKEFLKLHEGGNSYTVVAIMGPQSSGKSTLLNQLFSTKFDRMKSEDGRNQCTRGVWIAKAPDMEPPTMVLDLEGADGVERGSDDVAFEKQIPVFALAVVDLLIINMWCHDIGRQKGGGRDLLKDIFEAMLRLGLLDSHAPIIMFVIRDKTPTPDHILKRDLRKNVEEIWKTVEKPESHEDTTFSDTFRVEITILSHYVYAPSAFENEVEKLRSRLNDLSRQNEIPLSHSKEIWDMIKGYKDFQLPSHKEMVANVRCEEIAKEKLRLFASDKEWLALQQAPASKLVPGFIRSISAKYVNEYDVESTRYEKRVSEAKREYLISEVLKVVYPTYRSMLEHRRSVASREFETQLKAALSKEGSGFADSVKACREICERRFDEQCCSDHESFSIDISIVRRELLSDIENIWLSVRADKLPQIVEQIREKVFLTLSNELSYILGELGDKDIWISIRDMVKRESDAAALSLPSAIAGFELDQKEIDEKVRELKHAAREAMTKKFREETKDVATLLKRRYIISLYEMDCYKQIDQAKPADYAFQQCVKLLSEVAIIRLDETIGCMKFSLLSGTLNIYDSYSGAKAPPEMILITRARCKYIWNQFKLEMEQKHVEARYIEDRCKKINRVRPPAWVITGLLALGFDSFRDLMNIYGTEIQLAMELIESGVLELVEGMGLDIQDPAGVSQQLVEYRQARAKGTNFLTKGFKTIREQLKQALKKNCAKGRTWINKLVEQALRMFHVQIMKYSSLLLTGAQVAVQVLAG